MHSHADASRQWSTPMGLVACGWVLTAAAALWWLAAPSVTDRLFIGALVLALAVVSAYTGLVRPRLHADGNGVVVRSFRGTIRCPWEQVGVRVQRNQRLGRTVEVLELEVPEQYSAGGLIVLTKLDLGTEVHEVAEQLDRLRP